MCKNFFLIFSLGTPDPNAEMATLVVLHVDEIELPWPKKIVMYRFLNAYC